MTAREIKIKQEDRSAAGDYLKKAADNYEQMLAAIQKDNSNAAATLAIQCAISSADAICVFEKGIRSISQDHFDACDLVSSLPIEEEVIEMTIPHKPQSSKQKYVITEKGREILKKKNQTGQ